MRRNEHSIARDAALRRLGDVNRLLVIGSVVLTGLLTDVAANAFPGRSPALLKRASERATAAAHKRAHTQCHVCAPGRTAQQSTESDSGGQSTESDSGGGCHVCAPGRTVTQSTAAPPPAPAPAPTPAPAPVVVSGGS